MKLSNKVTMITGGSRGIGFDTAKLFAENGASIVIISRDPLRIKDAESKIQKLYRYCRRH